MKKLFDLIENQVIGKDMKDTITITGDVKLSKTKVFKIMLETERKGAENNLRQKQRKALNKLRKQYENKI
jgi:hypothetical protein